jgi:hypothetical protein
MVLAAALGCQKSPYDLAPVRGKVTLGNQPVVGGKIMFAPVAKADSLEAGKAAYGRTESDGSFALTTFGDGDGAIVGEHWVTVFVPNQTQPAASESGESGSDEPTYKRRAVRQKQVVIAGQENEINIAL